jgi:hypothetical protein
MDGFWEGNFEDGLWGGSLGDKKSRSGGMLVITYFVTGIELNTG